VTPVRGAGRTLIHPGDVEVTDAQALAVLCSFRDLLPLDKQTRMTLRRDAGPRFVEGFETFVECLNRAIAVHHASIAVEDAALDLKGGES
jgi:hypothetical protein